MDIFFVNKIPLLITLSRNIDFTNTSHLPTHKSRDILKSFWRIYAFYLKRGFIITTVPSDGEFDTVQEIIVEKLSELMANLTSAKENSPKIEQLIWM